MKLIKRLFLLIALVLTIFCTGSAFADDIVPVDFGGTISAVQNYDKDILNNKDNELTFSATSQSTSTISNRRNENNSSANGNDISITKPNFNNDNLITYKKDTLYLKNNTELALLRLFHQIQPNAP
ncbi:MAG: hypothetical protein IJW73_05775 [Candidatus Gastranaerophilales bacterium]|nr:hypothetical protein [Candidatus Gastranaerophilales bacterium]